MHFSLTRRGAALAAAAAATALALGACSSGKPETPLRRSKARVFVMGFDGMDPTLARRWMDEGKLPNLKRLEEEGTFSPLDTTQPSESPVAWASFATGVNPGKHNIFDFLIRSFETYLPDLAGVRKEPPRFLWGLIPIRPPKAISTRGGTSFWVTTGRAGIKSTVLTVPMTWPPEEVPHGELLGGLPLPDIRGTIGTFSYWATDLSSFEEGSTEFGGYLKRLLFDGGVAHTFIKGPNNPILVQEQTDLQEKAKHGPLSDKERARLDELSGDKSISLPISVHWTENSGQAEIEVAGTRLTLKAGDWSPWVTLSFPVNFLVKIHGMVQFHVVRADSELQIYGSPVNFDPRQPPVPISKPDDFSRRLADQIGLYRTLGWAEATWPLNEGRLSEAEFLYDCEIAFKDREKLIFKNLERDDWDLFVAVIETTDRISHMMWRLIDPKHPMYDKQLAEKYGDSIEKIYRRADDLVGRIREKLPKDTVLMVVSDHGFHSFRRGVNLNTWLVQNGYMVFHDQGAGKKTLQDLFGHGKFWEGVDWSRTKAYAVGLGQIYFNLRGRESQGIVSTGAEYSALQDEIRSKLLPLTDPDDGSRIFADIYKRDDIYHGEYIQYAPDLEVGFLDGYRVGWQDTLGAIQRTIVENNNRKWSGDHCATASEISAGVFFSSRRVDGRPNIMDVAPTILKILEVPIPADLDGKPLQ